MVEPNVFSPEYLIKVSQPLLGAKITTYVIYRNPSSSLCSSYMLLIRAAVGGRTSSTKMKMAFSGESLMRLRIT